MNSDQEMGLRVDTTVKGFKKTKYKCKKCLYSLEATERPDSCPRCKAVTHEDDKDVPYRRPPKIGRNDKCPCNSGKKFKRCCWI